MPEDGTRPPLCVGSSPRGCLCCPESPWCAVQQLLTEASNAAEVAEKEKSNDESRWEVHWAETKGRFLAMRFTLVQAGLGARHGLRRCPHPSGFGSRERLGISHCRAKRDTTWQAKADNGGLKRRLWDLEKALQQAREDKRDIHEEMTRQYQELQKQTAAHSQRLEVKVKSLQEQLATRLRESQQTQETATQALAERDRTIAQLQGRLNAMEREYEKILHGSLDLVLAKTAEASRHWEEVGTTITVEHKERLQEFGLNPLEM
ncbi:dynein regulatory complex protein 12 [Sarcoramphus papa]